ncbi:MAG: ribosome-associated translation inhibitor RaiA [Acidimicrobiia bacterium]
MDVRVHGRNLRVAEDVAETAIEKVQHASRIFDDGAFADVEFSERQNPSATEEQFRVEITTRVASHTVRVEAGGADDRAALDVAVDKFERQLRRLKERLIQRSRKTADKRLNPAMAISDVEETGQYPRIVKTKRFAMRPMTSEEAALQMEMLGHDFFFFLDAESGTHCVLYHRHDGTLGLIEPE